MSYRFDRSLALVVLSFMVVACTTTPVARDPNPERVTTAKRFLHSWGAGEVAMTALKNKLQQESKNQPGMAEVMRRALGDFKAEEFEDLAAKVYARHLTQDHLAELAQFAESRTGQRFFQTAIAGAMKGLEEKAAAAEFMRQFNADEITDIMKFGQSKVFAALQLALPTINREMGEEGRRLGETKLREYLKRQ